MPEQKYLHDSDVPQKDFSVDQKLFHVQEFSVSRVRVMRDDEGLQGERNTIERIVVVGIGDDWAAGEVFAAKRCDLYATGAEAAKVVLAFYEQEQRRIHDEAMAAIRKVVG